MSSKLVYEGSPYVFLRRAPGQPAGVAHVAQQRAQAWARSRQCGARGAAHGRVQRAVPARRARRAARAQRQRVHAVRGVDLDCAVLCTHTSTSF